MLPIDFEENEGLYRAWDKPKELEENRNRKTSHAKIEIVPLYRNDFYFISFIDFSNLTSSLYFVNEVKILDDKISHIYVYLRKYKKSLRKLQYSFHIKFVLGKKFIHDYVKHNMIGFDYKYFKGIFCINIKAKSVNADNSLA